MTNNSFYNMVGPGNFGQRLEEIEADAQALKRSMLESSHMSSNAAAERSVSQVKKEFKTTQK